MGSPYHSSSALKRAKQNSNFCFFWNRLVPKLASLALGTNKWVGMGWMDNPLNASLLRAPLCGANIANSDGDCDCNTCGNDGISDGDCDDDNHHQQQQQPPKLGRHLLYQIQ